MKEQRTVLWPPHTNAEFVIMVLTQFGGDKPARHFVYKVILNSFYYPDITILDEEVPEGTDPVKNHYESVQNIANALEGKDDEQETSGNTANKKAAAASSGEPENNEEKGVKR